MGVQSTFLPAKYESTSYAILSQIHKNITKLFSLSDKFTVFDLSKSLNGWNWIFVRSGNEDAIDLHKSLSNFSWSFSSSFFWLLSLIILCDSCFFGFSFLIISSFFICSLFFSSFFFNLFLSSGSIFFIVSKLFLIIGAFIFSSLILNKFLFFCWKISSSSFLLFWFSMVIFCWSNSGYISVPFSYPYLLHFFFFFLFLIDHNYIPFFII